MADLLIDKCQKELTDRYRKEWDIFKRSTTDFSKEKPTNPLLLAIPPDYFKADYRVMIFGKETNGWEGSFPHEKGIEHLLDIYRKFCIGKHGGYFWNGALQLNKALSEKLKTSGKTMSVIWNNLIKVGKEDKGTPCEDILKWEDNWFDVVLFEVRELKPNIVIFFSGPDYDKYINKIFNTNDDLFEGINKWDKRKLARVKSPELPSESIRAYHPNHFLRNPKKFCKYLDEIVEAINING